MMVYTRPDIAFALGKLSQFMSNPAVRHGHGVKTLLRYLRSNADMPIVYRGGDKDTVRLVGYSDADYAADTRDRKSTMGQVFMLGSGPISWASRKQRSVSTSTTEAEYMALSECSRQAIWLAALFTELGYPEIIGPCNKMGVNAIDNSEAILELKGDNNGVIALVKNRQVSERSKHIDIVYYYIRDLQKLEKINVSYVSTNDMKVDDLTKSLTKQKFQRFLKLIDIREFTFS